MIKGMTDGAHFAVLTVLQQQGLLSAEQVASVTKEVEQGKGTLRDVLVAGGVVAEEAFAQASAQVLNLPYIDLRGRMIPKDVLTIIPESTARGHLVIAYEMGETSLKVAMADPNDRQIIEFIHKKVDRPVEVALCSATSVREVLNQYQESLETELKSILETPAMVRTSADLSKAATEVPVVQVTDAVLKHAILQRASDIHIEPLEDKVVIRYRVDGILYDKLVLPKEMAVGIVARIKVLSNLKIDEHRLPQDGRFKITTGDYQVSFRVSILPVFDGEKIVMRLLDESHHGLRLEDVGFSAAALDIFRRNINKPHGLILVTGPTGSGKTTTLYAAMSELNTPEVNISTIEDPIEYRMPRVNQTQVKPQIGLSFANGLRALVRQDPDIIMVGEIRDEETASLAINAALTGHLVLSTLHTNSAAGAMPRLLDMKVEAFLVASTINIIAAQRLVRQLCQKCRQPMKVTSVIIDNLKQVFDTDRLLHTLQKHEVVPKTADWTKVPLYQAVGCSVCGGGYKGRIGIYEILEVTPSIQKLITSNVTAQAIEDAARTEQNMITMLEDGFIKAVSGITTVEEILRVAKE